MHTPPPTGFTSVPTTESVASSVATQQYIMPDQQEVPQFGTVGVASVDAQPLGAQPLGEPVLIEPKSYAKPV